MKIDSGLSGYYYPNRTIETDRQAEEAPPRETVTVQRLPHAITGSNPFLSASLSNALWVIESAEASPSQAPARSLPADWVEDRYQEFT